MLAIKSGVLPFGEQREVVRYKCKASEVPVFILNFIIKYDDAEAIHTVVVSGLLGNNNVPVSTTIFNSGYPMGNGVQVCFVIKLSIIKSQEGDNEHVITWTGKGVPAVILANGSALVDKSWHETQRIKVNLVNAQVLKSPCAQH